jgi:hypothetical protein
LCKSFLLKRFLPNLLGQLLSQLDIESRYSGNFGSPPVEKGCSFATPTFNGEGADKYRTEEISGLFNCDFITIYAEKLESCIPWDRWLSIEIPTFFSNTSYE